MKFKQYLITEKPLQYDLYIDLDGVLVDFLSGVSKLFNIEINNHAQWDILKKDHWNEITSNGVDFWYDLPWVSDGHILWNYVRKYSPYILSAYPVNPEGSKFAKIGKRKWVRDNLGNQYVHRTITCKGIEKQNYASPTSILVDDSKRNIDQWISKGGIGIWHKKSSDTIKQLEKYL